MTNNKGDLISREALKNTIIEICGKCSNIITKYENGIPDGNCAIQHIMNIIDNAPTVEYPFYQEAYQTGYEEGYAQGYIDGSTGADWRGDAE